MIKCPKCNSKLKITLGFNVFNGLRCPNCDHMYFIINKVILRIFVGFYTGALILIADSLYKPIINIIKINKYLYDTISLCIGILVLYLCDLILVYSYMWLKNHINK